MRRSLTLGNVCLVTLVLALGPILLSPPPATAADGFTASTDYVESEAPGTLRLYGWAYDSDSPYPSIVLHVYVGGEAGDPNAIGYQVPANLTRDDVMPGYPHGFDSTLTVPKYGSQAVHIYAINVGGSPGGNALLWSDVRTIGTPPPPPPPPPPTSDPTATPTPAPPPSPPVAEPSVPPPPPPQISVRLKAIATQRRPLRLRIDVGPDLNPSNYRFTVQRKHGRKWRTVTRTQTLGPKDVSVLRLRPGRYRVVVPAQHDMPGARATIRLRR